jgi:hypothetical protein
MYPLSSDIYFTLTHTTTTTTTTTTTAAAAMRIKLQRTALQGKKS